jgi:hypothetical protein
MHYLFWSRVIPYKSITNVALKNINDRGNEVATIIVDRDRAKPLRLFGFRDGVLLAFERFLSLLPRRRNRSPRARRDLQSACTL